MTCRVACKTNEIPPKSGDGCLEEVCVPVEWGVFRAPCSNIPSQQTVNGKKKKKKKKKNTTTTTTNRRKQNITHFISLDHYEGGMGSHMISVSV